MIRSLLNLGTNFKYGASKADTEKLRQSRLIGTLSKMHLYTNKVNKKQYKINHLCIDLDYLGRVKKAGIYPTPHKHFEKVKNFLSGDEMKCKEYIKNNFDLISEI